MTKHIHISTLQGFTPAVKTLGLKLHTLLDHVGLTDLDETSNNQISEHTATQLLRYTQAVSGCDYLPLLMVSHIEKMPLGEFGEFLASAKSLGEAWHLAEHYFRTVRNPDLFWYISGDSKYQKIQFSYFSEKETPFASDITLAKFFHWSQLMSDHAWKPNTVYFRKAKPADISPYSAFYKTQIFFDHDFDGFIFNQSDFDIKLVRSNADHHQLLTDYMQSHFPSTNTTIEKQVIFLLEIGLGNETYHLNDIASLLNTTPRTLQRSLKAIGSNYQDLLTLTRLQTANFYLAHTNLPVYDVALKAGFKDSRSFSRFYKLQTQKLPKEARKLYLNQPLFRKQS